MISPFKEVPVQVEAAQQWRNGVGRAHSSRDGSAISSIPLPADAALMTGGLEWRGACRHLRPRQIRTGIDRPRSPAAGWDSGRRPVPVMSVCRLPSCACFPPAPSASSISMPLARKARAHRSSIVRLTRPIRVSTCTACRRRWANGGRWFKVIGPNAAASKTSFAPFDGVGQQVPRVRHSAFLNPFAVTMAGSLRSLVPLQCASLWQHEPTGAGCA